MILFSEAVFTFQAAFTYSCDIKNATLMFALFYAAELRPSGHDCVSPKCLSNLYKKFFRKPMFILTCVLSMMLCTYCMLHCKRVCRLTIKFINLSIYLSVCLE